MQPCIYEETIGRIKEFIENIKGMKIAINSIVVVIIIQVGTFLFLWGSLITTVNKNTEYLWNDMTHMTRENTRNLDRLISKLETIKFIAIQKEQKEQEIQGISVLDKK